VDAAEFAALGVYDADAPDAAARRRLLGLLVERGATADELLAWTGALAERASHIALRPPGARVSLRATTEALGMPLENGLRLWRALGLPEPEPDDLVVPEALTATFALLSVGADLFGEDTLYRLARVLGTCLSQIADAFVSAGIVRVVQPIVAHDDAGLELAEANFMMGDLLDPLGDTMGLILRMHLENAMRPAAELAPELLRGYEERTLAIGFADLTGSTAMAGALSFDELGDAISGFEDIAADAVGRGRGRLVKLIGDEVMFAAADPVAACLIGLDIISRLRDRPTLPLARVGICYGGVLVRHGDCFGPVVNRASRLVDLADPGTVLADDATQRAVEADPERAVGLSFEPQGDHALRGLDNKVTIARVLG
jgi:adenylate cyclase